MGGTGLDGVLYPVLHPRQTGMLEVRPQTSSSRDIYTGPDIETQDKAENMSRREGPNQLF